MTLEDLEVEIHLPKEGQVIGKDSKSRAKLVRGIQVVIARNYMTNRLSKAQALAVKALSEIEAALIAGDRLVALRLGLRSVHVSRSTKNSDTPISLCKRETMKKRLSGFSRLRRSPRIPLIGLAYC